MIYFLDGTIEYKKDRFVVVNAGGVGYKVFMTGDGMTKLPEIGGKTKVYTHQYIREDAMDLYGFLSQAELVFFESLIAISGVGPKMALSILSVSPVKMLASAIVAGDYTFLTRVSGVGRKTAEKIIIEMKDRIQKLGIEFEEMKAGDSEVLEALETLGYSIREAQNALRNIPKEVAGVENRIREALKMLGRK